RPTNAFILFRRENHGRIFQQNPHLSNNDVSKALGKEWKELPESEKEVYRQKARSLQQEHQEKYPDYKFTPQQ
ncbi:sex determining factor on Y, partial [Basidiobolus meristosporus CBS 931.73]